MTDQTSAVPEWQAGQRVAFDHKMIKTIERVTPSGMPVVDGRKYNRNGEAREKTTNLWGRRHWIAPLTPDLEAQIVRLDGWRRAVNAAFDEVEKAEKWLRANNSRPPSEDAIATAERLAAAISTILGERVA